MKTQPSRTCGTQQRLCKKKVYNYKGKVYSYEYMSAYIKKKHTDLKIINLIMHLKLFVKQKQAKSKTRR
jgi:hypothetical protein